MDFSYFLKTLYKRKWLILLVSLLSAGATYFLTKDMSVVYKSKSLIATGITENNSPTASVDEMYLQPFKVENQFSNLIEIINSRTVVGLLSKQLILHDLRSGEPFRELDQLKVEYTDEQLSRAATLFEQKFNEDNPEYRAEALFDEQLKEGKSDSSVVDFGTAQQTVLVPTEHELFNQSPEDQMMKDILVIMGYDYESLRKMVAVYRVKTTDFLKFEATTERPDLSAFIANTYSDEFTNYYKKVKSERSDNSVDFFTKLSYQKKKELNRKVESLKEYKLSHQVVNIDEQSTSRIGQIHELELKREEENRKIPSYRGAIKNIDRYLAESEDAYAGLQVSNQRIEEIKDEINELNDSYITGGSSDADLESQIESKKGEMRTLISEMASSHSGDVSMATQDLLTRKINTEIELDIARASVSSINRELGRLQRQVTGFVDNDATITAMEREIQVASDEYLDIVDKLNTAKFHSLSSANQLAQIEYGIPADKAEPSKTLFLSAFAGMLTFTFALVIVFVLAYLDMSLKSAERFKRMTNMELLGYLNKLKFKDLDLDNFFNKRSEDGDLETFKQLLRKIRYRIEQQHAKRILVTSPKENEGKTFLIISLAYTLSLNDKRVLLIDTNFKNNSLTEMLKTSSAKQLMANNRLIGDANLADEFISSGIISNTGHSGIDIIGNRGGYNSPSEIFAGKNFNKLLDELELNYDYIFLEGSSMNEYSDTQELATYADHVISVFSADTEIKPTDKQSMEFLRDLGDRFLGGVLNRVELENV